VTYRQTRKRHHIARLYQQQHARDSGMASEKNALA